jgi:hypothetical protein
LKFKAQPGLPVSPGQYFQKRRKKMNGTAAGIARAKARGTLIRVPDSEPGIIVVNGEQKSFTLQGVWKSPVAPALNMAVELEFDSRGAVTSVTAVDSEPFNRERFNQISGVAQEHGKDALKLAREWVGALADRMGKVTLGASVLVWIAWFLLPAAAISGGVATAVSFTFWNLLGTDFDNPMSALVKGGSHGIFALLGLLAIVAPFAAPYLRAAWARYLNVAPLAFLILGFVVIELQTGKVFGPLVKMGAPNPFSWSWGLFVLAGAALVVAVRALKKPANP